MDSLYSGTGNINDMSIITHKPLAIPRWLTIYADIHVGQPDQMNKLYIELVENLI